MTERKPTSEIVTRLREEAPRIFWSGDVSEDPAAVMVEAADRLAELQAKVERLEGLRRADYGLASDLATLDALRLPCPTCGGPPVINTGPDQGEASNSAIEAVLRETYRRLVDPCPDCSDGLMSHERAWKIVAGIQALPLNNWDYVHNPAAKAIKEILRRS